MNINDHKKGYILYKYILHIITFNIYPPHCDFERIFIPSEHLNYLLGFPCNHKSNFAN